MKELKTAGKTVCAALVFCLLYLLLFNQLYVADPDAASMIGGFYREKKNSLDVVYLGSSAAYSAFDTTLAYHEYGFTSYDFCSGAQPLSAAQYLIREAEKTQNPSLYIVDLRQVVYLIQEPVYIHRVTSYMPLSVNRARAAKGMLAYREEPTNSDFWDYFLVYPYFHNRWSAPFGDNEADIAHPWYTLKRSWEIGSARTIFHGYYNEWFENTDWQNEIANESSVYSEGKRLLPELQERALRDLCEFCRTLDTPVLFVNSPSVFYAEYYEEVNMAADIVQTYGFPYFDGIAEKDAMGIDNITDWFDGGHLNYYGSAKFTRYLSEYLLKRYALPDHRDDPAYDSWEEDYQQVRRHARQETTLLARMLQEIREQKLDAVVCFSDAPLSVAGRAELAALGMTGTAKEELWALSVRSGRVDTILLGGGCLRVYTMNGLSAPNDWESNRGTPFALCTLYDSDTGEILRNAVFRLDTEFERLSTLADPLPTETVTPAKIRSALHSRWRDSAALSEAAVSPYMLEGFSLYLLDQEIYADCVLALANTDCTGQTVYMEVENEEGQFRLYQMDTVERSDWADMMHRELYRMGGAGVHIPYTDLPEGTYTIRLYREKYGVLYCSGNSWTVYVTQPNALSLKDEDGHSPSQ